MTNEEAIERLKRRLKCAEYVDSDYCDCVDIEAIKVAIDALEKQIPKPLKRKEIFVHLLHKKIEYPQCPICGNDYEGTLSQGCYYCNICGQKLNWGESNECNEQSGHNS